MSIINNEEFLHQATDNPTDNCSFQDDFNPFEEIFHQTTISLSDSSNISQDGFNLEEFFEQAAIFTSNRHSSPSELYSSSISDNNMTSANNMTSVNNNDNESNNNNNDSAINKLRKYLTTSLQEMKLTIKKGLSQQNERLNSLEQKVNIKKQKPNPVSDTNEIENLRTDLSNVFLKKNSDLTESNERKHAGNRKNLNDLQTQITQANKTKSQNINSINPELAEIESLRTDFTTSISAMIEANDIKHSEHKKQLRELQWKHADLLNIFSRTISTVTESTNAVLAEHKKQLSVLQCQIAEFQKDKTNPNEILTELNILNVFYNRTLQELKESNQVQLSEQRNKLTELETKLELKNDLLTIFSQCLHENKMKTHNEFETVRDKRITQNNKINALRVQLEKEVQKRVTLTKRHDKLQNKFNILNTELSEILMNEGYPIIRDYETTSAKSSTDEYTPVCSSVYNDYMLYHEKIKQQRLEEIPVDQQCSENFISDCKRPDSNPDYGKLSRSNSLTTIPEEFSISKEDGDKSKENGNKFEEDGNKSKENGNKSKENGNKSEEGGKKSKENGNKYEEGGNKYEEDSNKSKENSNISEEDGNKSEENGNKSEGGGNKPEEGGNKSKENGNKSEEGGNKSTENSNIFEEDGNISDEGSTISIEDTSCSDESFDDEEIIFNPNISVEDLDKRFLEKCQLYQISLSTGDKYEEMNKVFQKKKKEKFEEQSKRFDTSLLNQQYDDNHSANIRNKSSDFLSNESAIEVLPLNSNSVTTLDNNKSSDQFESYLDKAQLYLQQMTIAYTNPSIESNTSLYKLNDVDNHNDTSSNDNYTSSDNNDMSSNNNDMSSDDDVSSCDSKQNSNHGISSLSLDVNDTRIIVEKNSRSTARIEKNLVYATMRIRRNKLNNGQIYNCFTQPFVTGFHGYRVQVHALVNYHKADIQFYVRVYKGNHDNYVSWPFKQKFCIKLSSKMGSTKQVEWYLPSLDGDWEVNVSQPLKKEDQVFTETVGPFDIKKFIEFDDIYLDVFLS